jgi:hypothetical protein
VARRLLLGAVALLLGLGCYDTPKPPCAFICGPGGACPVDYTCQSDNVCHLVQSGGQVAQCPPGFIFDGAVSDGPSADGPIADARADGPILDGPPGPDAPTPDATPPPDAQPPADAAIPDAALPDAPVDADLPDAT